MLRRSLNDIACGLAAHVRKNLTCVERARPGAPCR